MHCRQEPRAHGQPASAIPPTCARLTAPWQTTQGLLIRGRLVPQAAHRRRPSESGQNVTAHRTAGLPREGRRSHADGPCSLPLPCGVSWPQTRPRALLEETAAGWTRRPGLRARLSRRDQEAVTSVGHLSVSSGVLRALASPCSPEPPTPCQRQGCSSARSAGPRHTPRDGHGPATSFPPPPRRGLRGSLPSAAGNLRPPSLPPTGSGLNCPLEAPCGRGRGWAGGVGALGGDPLSAQAAPRPICPRPPAPRPLCTLGTCSGNGPPVSQGPAGGGRTLW